MGSEGLNRVLFALVTACACVPAGAQAHAPLSREIALADDGVRAAVRMPGFGWLLRADAQQPFVYACDALLGVQGEGSATPMLYRADGALLVGTPAGLRGFDASGCPLPGEQAGALAALPIAALARSPSSAALYAATSGVDAALYASPDGGDGWERRSALASGELVTALRVAGDEPRRVFASVASADMRSALLVSEDAGASFARVEQERALTLLDVESGAAAGWWAMARPLDGKRGMEILRAEEPAGPWTSLLRVNFFGGFTRDASGAIWVGDEGGGVFRSEDGGDSFVEVAPQQAVACLAATSVALWACTPGTPLQRAVATAAGASAEFSDVLAFANVDRMVECGSGPDVATTCAAAWNEWQVDVRMYGARASDAGPLADAATAVPPTRDSGSAAGTDADAGADAGAGAGCTIATASTAHPLTALWLVLAFALVSRFAPRARSRA